MQKDYEKRRRFAPLLLVTSDTPSWAFQNGKIEKEKRSGLRLTLAQN